MENNESINENECPKCGSGCIEAEEFDVESFTRNVICEDCGVSWVEQFTLTSIDIA